VVLVQCFIIIAMVVSNGDQPVADVVFLVEATANLSPYVESLKTNYIIPTLE
jgi:hypothetical protein